ncbi:MAG TPA: galactose oxidase-like domain-containing protein [Cellvibrio sp.]|nr:galactose oxidase-like domain-containing protein [Cellvibrio sp.]
MKLNFPKLGSLALLLAGCAAVSPSYADSWGPLVELRDNTNSFPNNKPSGGWFVTPIHATLLTDGNVLITGWGRRDLNSCGSGGTRKNGTSFVLNPNTLPNGGTLNIQPINEVPASGTEDVLYCAGHSPLADGRILHTGGARYQDLGGPNQLEYGLNYSRVFSQTTNAFIPVSSPMLGGLSGMEGLAWYPTNTRMADGKVMVVGGFSRCCDSSFSNRTLQTFDSVAFDQGQNPWTLISPHNAAPSAINPGIRDYIHSFLLPQPVTINGLERKMAFMGSNGQIIYANTDVGTPDNQRFVTASNSQRAFNAGGWDSTAALVSTGEIMTAGGTDDNGAAQRIDLYQPTTSTSRTIDTGIGRRNASSILLPDGTVLLINGGSDERNYSGDRRSPQIINLETGSVTTLNPWSNDNLERGYHNFALLLKDGRVLLGGGISAVGNIGCERADLRIYYPPYLTAGTRPVISNAPVSTSMTAGGSNVTLTYSGEALKISAQGGVVLMAVGSTTHSFDQNQRHVKLAYTQSGNTLTVTPPANTQIAPPGDYILFLVAQSGAPSTGITVRIEKSQASSSSSSAASSSTASFVPFHFRGTHNGWAEGDLMTQVAGSPTNYEICRNFTAGDGSGGPRFKIDPNGGWGSDPFPAADVAASGWTKVVINGSTRVILSTSTNLAANCGVSASSSSVASSATVSSAVSSSKLSSSAVSSSAVASSSSSVISTPFHFRGTHNGWAEGDLMTPVASSATNFEICRNFTAGDGGGGPRFKIDPNGGWGSDPFPAADVAASGWTKVVINGSTRVVVSTNTNLAANCGAAASSSSVTASSSSVAVVSSSSIAVSSSSAIASSVASSAISSSAVSSSVASSVASSSAASSAAAQIILKPTVTVTTGQLVYVVGNQTVLSSWNSAAGVPCALNSGSSTAWTCQGFTLPAGTAYEYKYIKRNGSGTVVWESGANRSRTAPSVTTSYTETWK